jgi:hypothetical protein
MHGRQGSLAQLEQRLPQRLAAIEKLPLTQACSTSLFEGRLVREFAPSRLAAFSLAARKPRWPSVAMMRAASAAISSRMRLFFGGCRLPMGHQ